MIANAKYLDSFQQDPKNVECTGYQEEKNSTFTNGERIPLTNINK
jgi:hypothetical protein